MLEQVLDYIHNYFEKDVVEGTFLIASGSIDVDFLQEGQYFKIEGSVFNDGVHLFPAYNLHDETFTGKIVAMAVPPAVIALCTEIEEWIGKYDSIVSSPYQSESFGGYSYTKKSGGNSGSESTGWEGVFRSRLNHWRKIS